MRYVKLIERKKKNTKKYFIIPPVVPAVTYQFCSSIIVSALLQQTRELRWERTLTRLFEQLPLILVRELEK